MNNTETIDENTYISAKQVFILILVTVLFPDINEIKAYNICKCKINKISKLIATRRYGKTSNDIEKEILKIKNKEQLKNFVEKIYDKYIFQEDIIRLLEV